MVVGVSEGFQKHLNLSGSDTVPKYKAQQINFKRWLFSSCRNRCSTRRRNILKYLRTHNKVIVKGINKEVVGELAANIRGVRPQRNLIKERGFAMLVNLYAVKKVKTGK